MAVPETEQPRKDIPAAEREQDTGLVRSLKDQSLRAAGISFLLADSALIASGMMSGKLKEASAGIFGLTAGAVGARYGNPKAEKQLDQMYRKLGDYLRKQGIEVPKDPTAESLSKEGGILDHIETFLYDHPSQVMNVLYSLIGVQFLRSGIQHNATTMKLSGVLLIAGALGGILISEKKPDPEHPPEGALQKAWSWIQEKPLRLTGTLFTANQAFLAMNALEERRNNPAQKSYMFKLLAVACFTFGNTMMALTSKSHGGGTKMDTDTLNALAETSAKVIAAQAPDIRDGLLEHVAGFLASQPNVTMTAPEISGMLHHKLDEVMKGKQPVSSWQGRTSQTSGTHSQPAL